MTILYISDFDIGKEGDGNNGYCNIGLNLCSELVANGYDIMALGLGYNRQEHHHNFTIYPVQSFSDLPPMVGQLSQALQIEAMVVALDIPHQINLLRYAYEFPYIGLFPLEAGPLCGSWAISLLKMDARLIMSQFGKEELDEVHVDSTFIPIGVGDKWQPPTPEIRVRLRQGLDVHDKKVVLTVADNQERKNLSRSMEIFAGLEDENVIYWLVTRKDSPVGWDIEDYAMELGILDRMTIWNRGMPHKQLWTLYACADAFLLTSKAEGLGLPVLEAMSMRVPVVGTRCSAIQEHLERGRGYCIEYNDPDNIGCTYRDSYGNGKRYIANLKSGRGAIKAALHVKSNYSNLDKAQQYVNQRTWEKSAKVLIETIESVKNGNVNTYHRI